MIVMGLISIEGRSRPSGSRPRPVRSSRARIAPAHREPVRRFLGRFRGRQQEVALEATTGWRFVVEEPLFAAPDVVVEHARCSR